MARKVEFDEVTVNGIEGCLVKAVITPEDRSVGIFGPGLEEIEVIAPGGQVLSLTEAEEDSLCEQLYERLDEYYYGDWDC